MDGLFREKCLLDIKVFAEQFSVGERKTRILEFQNRAPFKLFR